MNWGNRLLITFIVFGAGISYLVYRSMHVNFELVEKDYYKSELRYQDVIDGSNRANALSSAVKLEQTEGGVLLQMPGEMKNDVVSGTILFYCAYDGNKDRKFTLRTNSEGLQLIEKGQIKPGNYIAKIAWGASDKNYYSEKVITIY